jgi:hypothetical protein
MKRTCAISIREAGWDEEALVNGGFDDIADAEDYAPDCQAGDGQAALVCRNTLVKQQLNSASSRTFDLHAFTITEAIAGLLSSTRLWYSAPLVNRNMIKRGLIGVVATLAMAWSLWMFSFTARNLLRGNFHLAGSRGWTVYFLGVAMAIAMLWMSIRGFRLATGVDALDRPHTKVWRLFLGVILVGAVAKDLLNPGARYFQPEDLAQAVGMYIGSFLMLCLSIWLVRSAFPRWQQKSLATSFSPADTPTEDRVIG